MEPIPEFDNHDACSNANSALFTEFSYKIRKCPHCGQCNGMDSDKIIESGKAFDQLTRHLSDHDRELIELYTEKLEALDRKIQEEQSITLKAIDMLKKDVTLVRMRRLEGKGTVKAETELENCITVLEQSYIADRHVTLHKHNTEIETLTKAHNDQATRIKELQSDISEEKGKREKEAHRSWKYVKAGAALCGIGVIGSTCAVVVATTSVAVAPVAIVSSVVAGVWALACALF